MPEILPNYGLLQGLAEGLKSGFSTYQGLKKEDRDNTLKNLALKLAAQKEGYLLGDDNTLTENPEHEAETRLKLADAQEGLDSKDPNSDYSRSQRAFTKGLLKSLKPGADKAITDDTPGSMLSGKAGLLGDYFKGVSGVQKVNITQDNKADQQDRDDALKMQDSLDADKGRAGNLGQIGAKKWAAQRIKTLVYDENGNIRNLNRTQVREAGTALAQMFQNGGGQVALQQINHLVPASVEGDVSDKLQYIFGHVQPAQQQEFLKLMVDTADREEKLSQQQEKQVQMKRLSPFMRLQKRNPELYNRIYNAYLSGDTQAFVPAENRGASSSNSGGLMEPQAKPETKSVNGKNYRKVPGGWEEVE